MAGDITHNDIINIALDFLNKEEVGDIEQEAHDDLTRRIRARYQQSIDYALQLAKWPEARTEKTIATATPRDQGAFRWEAPLPGDCLKVWTVSGLGSGWKRVRDFGAGRLLLNMEPPVTVVYGRRIEPANMSDALRRLCGAQIALDVLPRAVLTTAEANAVRQSYRDAVFAANAMTGSEDGTDTPLRSTWLDAMEGL